MSKNDNTGGKESVNNAIRSFGVFKWQFYELSKQYLSWTQMFRYVFSVENYPLRKHSNIILLEVSYSILTSLGKGAKIGF